MALGKDKLIFIDDDDKNPQFSSKWKTKTTAQDFLLTGPKLWLIFDAATKTKIKL